MPDNGAPRGKWTTPQAQYRAFDALPGELRRAFWALEFDSCAIGARRELRKVGPGFLAAAIVSENAALLPLIQYAYYGPDHPAAPRYVPRDVLKKLGLHDLGKAAVA